MDPLALGLLVFLLKSADILAYTYYVQGTE